MKVPVTIVTVEAGDWKGLYVGGRLVDEGHSITVRQFVEALQESGIDLPFEFKSREANETEEQVAQDTGRMPDAL